MDDVKRATLCDMTAGFCTGSDALCLEVTVPTSTPAEHERMRQVIAQALRDSGYVVDWIPSL